MGRKKITIKLIEDERNRQVTFTKRRNGLLKKARELSILCEAEIAVVIFSNGGGQTRLHDYCSNDITETLKKLATFEGTVESRDNHSYNSPVSPYTQSLDPSNHRAPLSHAAALAALATTRRQRVHINMSRDPNMTLPGIHISANGSNFHPNHSAAAQPMHGPDDFDGLDDDDDDDDDRDSRDPVDASNTDLQQQYCNGEAKNELHPSSNGLSTSTAANLGTAVPTINSTPSGTQIGQPPNWEASPASASSPFQPESRPVGPSRTDNLLDRSTIKTEVQIAKSDKLITHRGLPPSGRNSFPSRPVGSAPDQPTPVRPEPMHPPATPLPSPRAIPSPRNGLSSTLPSPGSGMHGPRNPLSSTRLFPSPREMLQDLPSPRGPSISTPTSSQPIGIALPNSTQPQRRPRPSTIPPRPPMKWQKQLTIQIPSKNTDPPSPASAKRPPSDSMLSVLPSGSGMSPHQGGWTPVWGRTPPSQQAQLPPFRTSAMPTTPASESFPTMIGTPHNGDIPVDPLATPKGTTAMSARPSSASAYPPFPSPTSTGILPMMGRFMSMKPTTPTGGQQTGSMLGKRGSPDRIEAVEAHPSARSKIGESF